VLDGGAGHFVVGASRYHNTDGLNFGQQAVEVRERPGTMLGCHGARPLLIDVIDADQMGFSYVRQQPCMMKAEASYPEYTYRDWIHRFF
jgi:hypothetical protein